MKRRAWILCGAAALGSAAGLRCVDSIAGSAAVQASLQVQGIATFHRAGQTFVTWRELDPAPKPDLTMAEFATVKRDLAEAKRIRYRVYRSERPLQGLADAELIGEVLPLSAWDGENFGISPPAAARPPRYVVDEGKGQLLSGTGLFVYNPPRAGQAYYAVTALVGGNENGTVTSQNATATAVKEVTGAGVPVLQRVEKSQTFQYVENSTLRYYVRWETSTNSNIAGRPFAYLVAIPPNVRSPAPVGIHLHCWGGSMRDCFGWWFNAEKGAILVSSNEIPYDWWTGYHELLGRSPLDSPAEAKKGVVRPYSQRRLLSFVDWLATTMQLDQTRMFVAGNSMGGSGAIMLALRQPARVAWAISWVGVHVPALSPFKESYEAAYGKREWNVLFENGTPVWDHYNDVWYLQHHRDQDVGLIMFSNGKNDSAIGWPQAVQFFRALQETRQPHIFFWGQQGHGQRAYMPAGGGERTMPLDLRTDQSLPAFTRASLDDDPGSGTPESGAPEGQANAHLTWRTDAIIDEPGRWAITIAVAEGAPRSTATVDVTPRRLQQFKLKPGDRVEWTNSGGSSVVQRGELTADQWGLITVPQAQVSRGGNRITVIRK